MNNIYFLLLCIVKFCVKVYSGPIVQLSSGKYVGENIYTYNGVPYSSFKGIKFATVSNRFQEATPLADSNDIFNATNFGPICYQMGESKPVGEEDCLYLNVFTPSIDGSVPVIVYIYGGSFVDGSTNLYGADYFMESSKLVIISIAYRLGAFGFLYFDDPTYPANLGTRDQIFALQWVQKNVKYFGGDPSRVTIAGQSAGAASVSILMNSIAAKGLFIGAISESGTACALWAVQPRCTGIQRLRLLAEKLNCTSYLPKDGASSDSIVKCLRSKSPQEIIMKTQEFPVFDKSVPFPPIEESETVKNAVITTYPWLNASESVNLVPWITGVNSNEGSTLVEGPPELNLANLGVQILTPFFLSDILFYLNTASNPYKVTTEIMLNNIVLYLSDYYQFQIKMTNEECFFYPMFKCLRRNISPSYSYYFNYISSEEQGKIKGVGHSGELKYIWQPSYRLRLNGSKEDKEISNFFINTWTDFAYYQSVNKSSVKWERYDPKLDNVLIIDNKGIRMGTNPTQKEVEFWSGLNMSNQPNTKYCY